MKTNFASAALLLVSLSVFAACEGDSNSSSGPLKAPTKEAKAAALAFRQEAPGARVFFSQRTGEIMWIDGNGTPLARGSVASAQAALDTVTGFMDAHPSLYRIDNPQAALGLDRADALNTDGSSQGVITLGFTQLEQGIAVKDRHGVAVFDTSGNLLSLETQLYTSEEAAAHRDEILAAMASAGGAMTAEWEASGEAPGDESEPASQDKSRRRKVRTRRDRLAPLVRRNAWFRHEGRQRLVEERVERAGVRVTRVLRDQATGETLGSWDETPSDLIPPPLGWGSFTETEIDARDSRGDLWPVPSLRSDQYIVMALKLPGILNPSASVTISDSGELEDRSLVRFAPLSSTAASWLEEPAYEPELHAATRLASHLKTTVQWYASLGHRSWSGDGASFRAAIRGHMSSNSAPELNAWGGNGLMLIGDGATRTGQPISDALDIVGHEFTHSVIDATANFAYRGESGALNEALADLFGKAIEGYESTVVGAQAGAKFRDVADPEGCGAGCSQPGSYGDFIVTPSDNGGVHTNSGIINQAISQVILDPSGAVPLGATRAARARVVMSLVLDSLKHVAYAPDTSLEEFSATLSAYCQARERAGTLSAAQAGLCERLEASFDASELLSSAL